MHAAPADDCHVQGQAYVLRLGQQPVFRQCDLEVEGPVSIDRVLLAAGLDQANAPGLHLPQPVPCAAGEVESEADSDVALRQRTCERHPTAEVPRTQHHVIANRENKRSRHRLPRQLHRPQSGAGDGAIEIFDPPNRDPSPARLQPRRDFGGIAFERWPKLHRSPPSRTL